MSMHKEPVILEFCSPDSPTRLKVAFYPFLLPVKEIEQYVFSLSLTALIAFLHVAEPAITQGLQFMIYA
jgi:hypothetical protein